MNVAADITPYNSCKGQIVCVVITSVKDSYFMLHIQIILLFTKMLLHKDTCCWVHVLDGQWIFKTKIHCLSLKMKNDKKKIHYPIFFDVEFKNE